MMVQSADQSISENCIQWFEVFFILLSLSVFSCTVSCTLFFVVYFMFSYMSQFERDKTSELNIDGDVNV